MDYSIKSFHRFTRIGISTVLRIKSDYGKPYNIKNFFARNKIIAAYSHYVVAFVPRGVESKGSSTTISYAKKVWKKNHRYRLDIYIYVYMKKQIKLTSVKIIESLYNNFKIKTVNSNMNLQKLVNRVNSSISK